MFVRPANRTAGLAKNRLEAVVDGVTGFVLTVLVFDIIVPPAGLDASALPGLLRLQLKPLFTFFVTGAVIGTFWLGHAHQMNFITRLDRTLVWTNFGGLALVALLPFTTSFLGRYLGDALPTAIYGANVALIGVAGLLQWRWAARNRHLLRPDTPPEVVRDLTMRIVAGVALAFAGVAVAFVQPWLAMGLYALAFLPFAVRGRVDDHLKHE
jgi:uncharacterized membrane protein